MAFSDRVPQYRVDIDILGVTNAWVPTPFYTGSPYYPYITVKRRIALSAQFGTGDWYTLFYGYIETITPQDIGSQDGNVTITASDWLARANTVLVDSVRPIETDQARFLALASIIGTDTQSPVVVGPTTETENVQAITYTATSGLTILQDLATTTRGVIYADRTGRPTYRTRYGKFSVRGAFWLGGYTFDQVGLNPAATVFPYESPLDYDLTMVNLFNDIRVTPSDSTIHTATDATSQSLYTHIVQEYSLPQLDPARASDYAAVVLAAYKDPKIKVHTINLDGDAWLANNTVPPWNILFGLELGDSVTVVKSQPAHASINKAMFIEGITHTILPDLGGHKVQLQLSDQVQSGVPPWILGTSQLGVNANLAY
jgi:hypothetical protein